MGPDALTYSKVKQEKYFIHVNYGGNPPSSSDYDINGIKSVNEASNEWVSNNGAGWYNVEFYKTGPKLEEIH